MGVLTYTDEHISTIPPSRIFKASIIDSHNLMPKLLPDAIKSVEFIKGDGGVKSIKQINFAGGKLISNPISINRGKYLCLISKIYVGYVKHQIDEVNEKTFTYKCSLIEGMNGYIRQD